MARRAVRGSPAAFAHSDREAACGHEGDDQEPYHKERNGEVIYVNRNTVSIPGAILTAAIEAQEQLEALPAGQRAEFIRRRSHIWRAFRPYLCRVSYGKWYSENPEVQSFLDVDHYRPKLEAKRSEVECDPGYGRLAFSWGNFRLAAQRSKPPEHERGNQRN